MADAAEIGTVWRAETRRVASSARGLAFMVLFLFAEMLTLGAGGCANVALNKQFDSFVSDKGVPPEVARAELAKSKRETLRFFTRNSDATIDKLADIPIVLLVVFFVTTFFVPLLVALVGFDQISAEVGPRSMRFLVVRAQRDSVLIGKYLSQLTVLAVLLFVCVVAMTGVSKYLNPDFSWPLAIEWTLRLWLVSMVLAAAYAALTTMCSTLTRIPPLSLFFNVIGLFVFWFIGLISNAWSLPGTKSMLLNVTESPLAYIRYIVPSSYESFLLSPAPLELAAGLFAFAGFAFVFLGLARIALDERDL
ncbi:MAG: ABC transporter permease subunit [Myxococcaceae bacterium]